MTYCWKCPECGWRTETNELPEHWKYQMGPTCDPCWDVYPCHSTSMDRDWKAESANVNVEGLH